MKSDWHYYLTFGASSASQLTVSISDWQVMHCPLTYTVDECVEAWCELVGWKLKWIRHTNIPSPMGVSSGRFYFELPDDQDAMDIVRRISRRFNRRNIETNAGRRQRRIRVQAARDEIREVLGP